MLNHCKTITIDIIKKNAEAALTIKIYIHLVKLREILKTKPLPRSTAAEYCKRRPPIWEDEKHMNVLEVRFSNKLETCCKSI